MTIACKKDTPALEDLEAIDLSNVKLDPRWSHSFNASGAIRFRAIALCQVGEEVVVVTANRRTEAVQRFVSEQLKQPFRLVRGNEEDVRRLLRQIYPQSTAYLQADRSEPGEAVRACDELLRAAVIRGASDIHLVPEEKQLHSKLRVDGVLEDYRSFPVTIQSALVSRIKVMAGMNIAEKREPQDGRFSIKDADQTRSIDIRVAAIPTRFGERLTLRLLVPMSDTPSLEQLGMNEHSLEVFSNAISGSHGLVLLTGPTGCGKSTTLYTAISQLLRSHRGNVITVEDPIEHEIPGASQVEVDSAQKVSFASALRSILRHDPDVIMLGEIRDAETAEMAIKAALTGHLVFSTLHTNTAAGVVTRLIDMGVEPFLVAATLRLAVAQRLVRRLCSRCKETTPLVEADAVKLGNPELVGHEVHQSRGCVYCAGKGYVGRVAMFEMLPVGDVVSKLIANRATEGELLQQMEKEDHALLIEDGISKVLSGVTTAQQVLDAVAIW